MREKCGDAASSRFESVPCTWHKAMINEICRMSSGSTPRRDNANNFNGTILWVSSGELKKKFVLDTNEKISQEAARASHLKMYEPGAVVAAIYGLEAAGIRGTASIIKKQCTISQACMAFTDFKGIDNEFFYYWYILNGPRIGHRYAQGTKQQNLSTEIVGTLQICFPPLPEQRKIAAILATQDKVIELKAKLLEETKRRKKALMQRLLAPMEEKRLEAASPCGEAASCRFGDNNKLVFMDDIGFTYSGLTGMSKADFVKGNAWYIPFLNVLKNTKIDLERLEQVNISESEKQTEVRKGDLLFNISSETPNEVGLCAYLANDVEYTYLNSFCIGFRLKPDAKIEPHYLVEWFNSCYGRRIMRSLAQGATRYNLSREYLLAIPIILPPIAVQRRIVAVLSTADREIDLMEKELNALELKKKALMQLLLTGIVRVGEAASCRLERAGNEAAGSRFSTRIANV